jgi:hypothetical protein
MEHDTAAAVVVVGVELGWDVLEGDVVEGDVVEPVALWLLGGLLEHPTTRVRTLSAPSGEASRNSRAFVTFALFAR